MRLAELDRPEQEKNFPRKIMPQIRQPDLDDGPFSYKLGNTKHIYGSFKNKFSGYQNYLPILQKRWHLS